MRRWRRALAVAAGLAAGVALLGGALELLARVSPRFAPRLAELRPEAEPGPATSASGPGGSALIHPFLGWVPRGAGPPSAEVADDAFAVGLFGGSLAAGLADGASDLLARALEERFPRLAGRVVVASFAAAGAKQPQQLLSLALARARGARLDLVVNLDGLDEIVAGVTGARAGRHPLLPAPPAGADLAVLDPTREGVRRAARALRERAAADTWVRRAEEIGWTHSRLLQGLAAWRARVHRARAARLQRSLPEPERAGPSVSLHDDCVGPEGDCTELVASLWANASRAMAALAAGAGAGYVHGLEPDPYLPGAAAPPGCATPGAAPVVAAGYPVLRARGEALRDAGIDFVDLSTALASREAPLYAPAGCRLNRKGYAILVRALVARLPAISGR